jgi:GT2 family glycosyltransferase/glycosyltransferase involved in cell wall biosynthesis
MWGTTLRQRLRLAPLHGAVTLADGLARISPLRGTCHPRDPWDAGLSVIIPDRDAPDLLDQALASLCIALQQVDEPAQIIVVANGAPRERYDAVLQKHASAEFIHCAEPLGFSAAIARGLALARFDWTLLLNNDMTLEPSALRELAAHRGPDVFAIAAQIMQQSADQRREETGLVDWYVDAQGIRVFHAPPGRAELCDSLCASGGAALFRTAPLRRYAKDSAIYDPFYWEDVEWGVRARQDSYRVLFCAAARARHRHRATTARFYEPGEIDRVVERNRVLFDLRNAATQRGAGRLLQQVCDQPHASQRELATLRIAFKVLRQRYRSRRCVAMPTPPVLVPAPGCTSAALTASFSHRASLRSARPRLLLVTPYCIYPSRHGGARRVAGLLQRLRREYDVVLVTDEASLHDARSFEHFDALHEVVLVQRPDVKAAREAHDLAARMHAHCHGALRDAVRDALVRYRPELVQIEHVELAPLGMLRTPGQRWILGLHDAFHAGDFADPGAAARFQAQILAQYDAVTVCSAEDQAMIAHPRTVCVPNGASFTIDAHVPSSSAQLLFMGPFRYTQNYDGIRQFLRTAYPAIKAAVPSATLLVLGGDGAPHAAAADNDFAQPDVRVLAHRDDVPTLLAQSALTLNPLTGIRGSSVKVIESLAAGRACICTADGARGFVDAGLRGLITVANVRAMIEPIIALLQDPERRHRIEAPDASALARFHWQHCAEIQGDLYRRLLASYGA